MAFLNRLNPSVGSHTAVYAAGDGAPPLIGHLQYTVGDRSARILFLMPEEGLNQPGLINLLEHMAVQAGSWGAFHLLAEIDETSCALDGLRRSGFSVYAWQRIWKYQPPAQGNGSNGNANSNGKNGQPLWQPAASTDEIMIRSLYQALVPPLVQSAEPLTSRRLSGWVYRQEGEILAYVEGVYGPHGIYLQPLVHPAVENVNYVLANLLIRQPTLLGRSTYLSIRYYQTWLETVMRDLECQVGPRQALMVKHLVLQQRVAMQVARHSMLEKYTTEPTVPLMHNSSTNE